MKLTLKEQLIWLMIQQCPRKLLKAYYETLQTYEISGLSLAFNEMRQLLQPLISKDYQIFWQKFSSNQLTRKEHDYLNYWQKYCLIPSDKAYPPNWYELPDPPVLVFYQGDLNILTRPLISLVGTRQMTPYGKEVIQQMVQAMATESWALVSGLALGVDTAVHQAVKQHPPLATIAIIPGGLYYFYPRGNRQLETSLYQNQLVLSEYLPHSRPLKHQFIMRNRLIAGISEATIVIEAAAKSGSLITANYALQFNREVYAVAGRLSDRQSAGCNELIGLGANPIHTIAEFIADLKMLIANHQS